MAKTNCNHLIQITIYLPDALLPGVDSPDDTQDSEHNIIIRDVIFRVVIKSRGPGDVTWLPRERPPATFIGK